MSFKENLNSVNTLKDKLAEAKAKLQEEALDLIKPLFKSFMEEHPELVRMRWCQYTPYFNDGEPCTFRVCEPDTWEHYDEEED